MPGEVLTYGRASAKLRGKNLDKALGKVGTGVDTDKAKEDKLAKISVAGDSYAGGDVYDYLGRFRKREFLTQGHNSTPVGLKVKKLMKEGKSQKQAVATALNMKRKGRLTKSGGYKAKR